MSMYTVMTWDVSRTGGRGGLQLHWQERKGWFYALAGLSQFDVHFYTVLTPLRTPMPAPETVADVAEHPVRFRRITETEYWEPWEGAGDVQVAANDFRRARLGLPPLGRQRPEGFGKGKEHMEGEGVQLTIDTQRDTYEQAIAAVQAAYGLNPAAVTSSWPPAPRTSPGRARKPSVARTSVRAGRRGCCSTPSPRSCPAPAPSCAESARLYRIEPALVEGLKNAFDLAEIRPDLLRQESAPVLNPAGSLRVHRDAAG